LTGLDKNKTLHEDTLYLGTSDCTITETTAEHLHMFLQTKMLIHVFRTMFLNTHLCFTQCSKEEMTTI